MKLNKMIAKKEIEVLKGIPSVYEYSNDLETKKIDILNCKPSVDDGIQAFATIGLNKTDIGLTVDSKPLKVELVCACGIDDDIFGNIISNAAFDIMDSNRCFPGYIIKNVIGEYVKDTKMEHLLLTSPFLWEDLGTLSTGNEYVTWLMIIPISNAEMQFAEKHNSDELEDLFEEQQIDILDLYRESVV